MELDQNEYIVQRPMQFAFNVVYQGLDSKGNTVFAAKQHMLGGNLDLLDASGKAIGSLHTKFSLKPQYELFDGNSTRIGRAVKTSHIISLNSKYQLEDASGAIVAVATGEIMGYNYTITDQNGYSSLATISKISPFNAANASGSQGFGGLLREFVAITMNASKLTILDQSFNKLLIVEFTIAIDHIANHHSGNVPFSAGGVSNQGFGGIGIGGGGINL